MKLLSITLLVTMTLAFQFDQDFAQFEKIFEQNFKDLKNISSDL